MLEKTLESPIDCKDIKAVNPKGNQPWMFIGRTEVEAESPIFWPPDVKSQLIGKDPDAGKIEGKRRRWGWDGRIASLTQWAWIWASSGKWWKTGKTGVLQSMGLQSQTRLSNWTKSDQCPLSEWAYHRPAGHPAYHLCTHQNLTSSQPCVRYTNTYAASQQWISQTAKTFQELTDNFIQVEKQQIPVTFSSTALRPRRVNQVVLYLKISLESEMSFSKLPHTIIHCITSLHIPFKTLFWSPALC